MSLTITYNTDVLFNAIKFQQTASGKYYKYSTNDRLYLTKDVTYEIKYRLYVESQISAESQTSAAPFDLYITASGGAKPFVDVDTLGYNVEVLSVSYNTFLEKKHLITPTSTGTGSLCLALKYGTYYISDIVIQPYSDVDTSVPEMRIIIPMPPGVKRYESISLYPIYIGGNNNPVGDVSTILSEGGQSGTSTLYKIITGSNVVISNSDNLVAGSLYIGSQLRSGIEISGESSAMIRSVGYAGFLGGAPGFLFYSGSALSGSGDNYRGVGVEISAGTGNGFLRMRSDNSGSFLQLYVESASFGDIYCSGSIYAEGDITAFSDRRLKKDIIEITSSMNIITKLNGIKYRRINNDDRERIGLIAQDVEPYLPQAVSTNQHGYKLISYGNIVAVLIEGMKEQQKEIDELKNAVNLLKNT